MLGFSRRKVLGQFDPFTGAGRPPAARGAQHRRTSSGSCRCDPTDFRLWVCLHEETHRVQFTADPWLAGYMRDTVAVLGEIGDEP